MKTAAAWQKRGFQQQAAAPACDQLSHLHAKTSAEAEPAAAGAAAGTWKERAMSVPISASVQVIIVSSAGRRPGGRQQAVSRRWRSQQQQQAVAVAAAAAHEGADTARPASLPSSPLLKLQLPLPLPAQPIPLYPKPTQHASGGVQAGAAQRLTALALVARVG